MSEPTGDPSDLEDDPAPARSRPGTNATDRLDALVALSTGGGAVAFGVLLAVTLAPRFGAVAALPGLFFVAAGLLSLRGGLDDRR